MVHGQIFGILTNHQESFIIELIKQLPSVIYLSPKSVVLQWELGWSSPKGIPSGQMAEEHDIPCITVCKKGIKPSSMIEGNPCTKKILYYEDIEDLSSKLEKILINNNY